MSKGKLSKFRVRFKEMRNGRDGGLGPVKSFKTTARSADKARARLRKPHVKVISVRRVK